MESVAIVGVGQSIFSRHCGISIRELSFEAFREAMEGLSITTDNIDASIICSAPEYDKQRTPSVLISEYLGLAPKPTFYVESVCSSTSMGLRVAWSLVSSGLHKTVAVIGFQKMSELTSQEASVMLRPVCGDIALPTRTSCIPGDAQTEIVRYYQSGHSPHNRLEADEQFYNPLLFSIGLILPLV